MAWVAFFITICFGVTSVWAAPNQERINPILHSLNQQLAQPLFNDTDKALIGTWFEDTSLPSGEAEKKMYDLYLTRRLELLSPEKQLEARARVETILLTTLDTISGAYTPEYGSLIALPYSLERSAYRFSLLAHEGEHALQYFLMEVNDPDDFYDGDFLKTDFVTTKFLMEKGAMSAEWHFLHHLPAAARDRLISRIKSAAIDEEARINSLKIVESSSLSLDQYLVNEWSRGRYSFSEIAKASGNSNFSGDPSICKTYLSGI